MEDISKDELINRIVADTIMRILTDTPTDIEKTQTRAEKSVAWIEVYDDVLDEAYDMSQEYREYE